MTETTTTTDTQTPEHSMRIDEVAALLGVHTQTVRVWIRMKALPCIKPGRELLFSRREVLDWYARQRRRPSAPRPTPATEVPHVAHE